MFYKYDTVQITGHFGTLIKVGGIKITRGLLYEFSHTEQLGFYCFENVSILLSKRFNYNNFRAKQSFSGLCKIQRCRIVLVEKTISQNWLRKNEL
jgi:hypothetical protein